VIHPVNYVTFPRNYGNREEVLRVSLAFAVDSLNWSEPTISTLNCIDGNFKVTDDPSYVLSS